MHLPRHGLMKIVHDLGKQSITALTLNIHKTNKVKTILRHLRLSKRETRKIPTCAFQMSLGVNLWGFAYQASYNEMNFQRQWPICQLVCRSIFGQDYFQICTQCSVAQTISVGGMHKLRWQDEVGRWYWKCQQFAEFPS